MFRVVAPLALFVLLGLSGSAEARVLPRLLDHSLAPPTALPGATYDTGGGATREELSAVVGGVLMYGCGVTGISVLPVAVIMGIVFSSVAGTTFAGTFLGLFIASIAASVLCIVGFGIGVWMVAANAESVLKNADKPSSPAPPPRPTDVTVREAEAGPSWALR